MRLIASLLLSASLAACAQAPGGPTPIPGGTAVNPAMVDRGTLGVSPGTSLFQPGQVERFAALPQQIFTGVTTAVTWSVDDPSVATVTQSGQLTAVAPGLTWLRARGYEGEAAHPISVASVAPTATVGVFLVTACTGGVPATSCSMIMKGGGTRRPLFFTYRRHESIVVAEFLMDNDRNRAALVGMVSDAGALSFLSRAWLAPVLSLGAGGCCAALSNMSVIVDGASVVSGTFTTATSSTTLHYRITIQ